MSNVTNGSTDLGRDTGTHQALKKIRSPREKHSNPQHYGALVQGGVGGHGDVTTFVRGDAYLSFAHRAEEVQREFFIDNLLVRIHLIIVMIRWTGLAPWESEFPFPGSLSSTFLEPEDV